MTICSHLFRCLRSSWGARTRVLYEYEYTVPLVRERRNRRLLCTLFLWRNCDLIWYLPDFGFRHRKNKRFSHEWLLEWITKRNRASIVPNWTFPNWRHSFRMFRRRHFVDHENHKTNRKEETTLRERHYSKFSLHLTHIFSLLRVQEV